MIKTQSSQLADELDKLIREFATNRQVAAVDTLRDTGEVPREHKGISPNFLYGRENLIQGVLVYTAPDWVKRTTTLVRNLEGLPMSRDLQRNVQSIRHELGLRPTPVEFGRNVGECVYVYTRPHHDGMVKIGKSDHGWGEMFKQGRGTPFPTIPLMSWTSPNVAPLEMEKRFHQNLELVKINSVRGNGAGQEWFYGTYDTVTDLGRTFDYALHDLRDQT